MQKISLLYIFLGISLYFMPLFGQETEQKSTPKRILIPWQEQILQLVDIEELGEDSYNELLEELSELVLWSDTLPNSLHRIKQQIILSSSRCLNNREGFLNQTDELQQKGKAYLGDPWKQNIRYRLNLGKQWQVGLNMEKDSGEKWGNSFTGFDSWHAFVRFQAALIQPDIHQPKLFTVEDAVIGHYRLRIGYGLTMNQTFSLGKQYFNQQISQRTNRISPFASNAESNYMQGAAFDLRIGQHLHLLPYFSLVPIDGNLSNGTSLTTLYTDGMHRTKTEMAYRQSSWQMAMGMRAGWNGPWYEIGVHVLNTQFKHPYIRKEMSHNHNYFRGQTLTQIATDYQIRAFNNILRGEFAADDKLGFALLNSLQTNWSDDWQSALIYHYYSNTYRQLFGSSIGENSEMQGEQGMTFNLSGTLSKNWQLQAMADWTNFGQLQYQTKEIPKDSYEGLVRSIYSRRWITATLGYRIKSKNENVRHSIDAIINIDPLKILSLKTQIRKRINQETSSSEGFAVAQSINYNDNINKDCTFNIDAQFAYFDTDDYNSRIYINEKNILYGFGFPMLYGKGVRYNLTGNIKFCKNWNIDVKYALTNYANKKTISSGLQEIKGNTQQDLWLQIRLTF